MSNVHRWTALRSGRAIEVRGFDAAGHPVSIKTSMIHAPDEHNTYPTAQDERGQYHNLI